MIENRDQLDARRQRCSDAALRPGRHDVGFSTGGPAFVRQIVLPAAGDRFKLTVGGRVVGQGEVGAVIHINPDRDLRQRRLRTAIKVLRGWIRPRGQRLSKRQLIRAGLRAMLEFSDRERIGG